MSDCTITVYPTCKEMSAEIARLRSQLVEARAKAIEDAAMHVADWAATLPQPEGINKAWMNCAACIVTMLHSLATTSEKR